MSTMPRQFFTFEGYTVRAVTAQDKPYLEELIAADPYHRHKIKADFFLKLEPGEDAWALEDAQGQIVFYFKTEVAVRMHIQFGASETLADRHRNLNGLIKGLRWIEGIFRANRFREIIFDVDGPELRNFAQRRLGFVEASQLSRMLPSTLKTPKSQPESLGNVPTDRLERVG